MATNIASPTRKVIRGDSDKFVVTFNNVYKNNMNIKVKTPIDISNWVVRFTVRKNIPATSVTSDVDAIISKEGRIADGKSGQAYILVTEADTNIDEGEYWYDIQYTYNIGTDNEVTKSLSKGKYLVVSDITRSAG